MPLDILTHNVNGFDQNSDFDRDTCFSLSHCIYGLQEHWMRPPSKQSPGVTALQSLHPGLSGWGRSAMKTSMESTIRKGRPFGGTGFVWTKTLSPSIKPRTEFLHERVTVLELNSTAGSILVINCYLPYFKGNNDTTQIDKYADTIGYIDSIIEGNPESSYIIIGDMNCDIFNVSNEFSALLKSFIDERGLHCTYDSMSSFDSSTCFTRCNLKQQSFSLLDYVFVSKNLVNCISDVSIMDSGSVLSDHFPVKVTLSIDLLRTHDYHKPVPTVVNWRSVKGLARDNYERVMEHNLNQIRIPHIVHGNSICESAEHIFEIERYYADIVHSLFLSDLQLPRC